MVLGWAPRQHIQGLLQTWAPVPDEEGVSAEPGESKPFSHSLSRIKQIALPVLCLQTNRHDAHITLRIAEEEEGATDTSGEGEIEFARIETVGSGRCQSDDQKTRNTEGDNGGQRRTMPEYAVETGKKATVEKQGEKGVER
jgi:hypothetical protein